MVLYKAVFDVRGRKLDGVNMTANCETRRGSRSHTSRLNRAVRVSPPGLAGLAYVLYQTVSRENRIRFVTLVVLGIKFF